MNVLKKIWNFYLSVFGTEDDGFNELNNAMIMVGVALRSSI